MKISTDMPPPASVSDELNPSRILVVDDDEHNLRLFREILLRQHYRVDDAESGEMALKKIVLNHYDLVISDLHMYQVDGLDVLNAAKCKDAFTQVLILTGFGTITSAVEAMKKGAYEYLSKPIDQDALVIKVNNALEHRRMLMLVEEQQQRISEYHNALESDLKLARCVHESLIPKNYENPYCEVVIEYLPLMGIGGDFVDIYDDHNGKLYLTTLDITGHGITAALMVNRICSEIRKLVREHFLPREILYHLNQFFYTSFVNTGLFLTIMSIMIDYKQKMLIHAGSAHPAGLFYSAKSKSMQKLIPRNIIIGFESVPLSQFTQEHYELNPGDRIFMYTDGLVEVENKDQHFFGTYGLKKCLEQNMHQSNVSLAKSIITAVREFGYGELQDDVLLIVAQLK